MLVINCTKAAADFFTVTRSGKKLSPLAKAPTPLISDIEHDNQTLSPWLVHAIKIQRKHVLIAVHVHTRYAMVFVGIKKGDWQDFLTQLVERLFNSMQFLGEEFELCDEESFQYMLTQFIAMHPKPYFCQRGDRSVQSHINDVAWQFEDRVYEIGVLPCGHEQAAGFDEWMNSMSRKTKQKTDYFHPDEEMFIHWMKMYNQFDSEEEQRTRKYFLSLRRQVFSDVSEEVNLQELDELIQSALDGHIESLSTKPDNVIPFRQDDAKKNNK